MRKSGLLLVVLAGAAGLGLGACGDDKGNVFSLEVGQCFNDPDNTSEVSDVPIVDCDEPHDNEVYHTFDIEGDDYPGEEAVTQAVLEGCIENGEFEDFVGVSYESSELYLAPLTPTEESWAAGDREVVCALYDGTTNEPLVGTAEGANR